MRHPCHCATIVSVTRQPSDLTFCQVLRWQCVPICTSNFGWAPLVVQSVHSRLQRNSAGTNRCKAIMCTKSTDESWNNFMEDELIIKSSTRLCNRNNSPQTSLPQVLRLWVQRAHRQSRTNAWREAGTRPQKSQTAVVQLTSGRPESVLI